MTKYKIICRDCPRQPVCKEPCHKVEWLLDSPDRARPRRDLDAKEARDIETLIERAGRLDSQTRAMVFLYFRCGFTLRKIAEAFEVNPTTVLRRIRNARVTAAARKEEEPTRRRLRDKRDGLSPKGAAQCP